MTDLATSDDYTTYTGGSAPANVVPLLRWASRLVADAVRTAVFRTDSSGTPLDQAVLDALRDATCAQAAAGAALKIDPLAGGAATLGQALSKTLDGAAITYAGASEASAARAAAVDNLVPDAVRILEQAGLTSTRVWILG